MTPPDLSALSDMELSCLVARECAGWKCYLEQRSAEYTYFVWQKAGERAPWASYCDADRMKAKYAECEPKDLDFQRHIYFTETFPRYATSADAVLPLLEKWPIWECERVSFDKPFNRYRVSISTEAPPAGHIAAFGPTFARAAVEALLKAHRAK